MVAQRKVDKKKSSYEQLLKRIYGLIDPQAGLTANLANVSAAIKEHFPEFSWVGFYLLRHNTLWVGPYQGKVACTRIKKGEGVCGTAIEEKKAQIVPDVSKIENHIYCDPDSQSEIVVPLIIEGKVQGVLDIDSYNKDQFDKTDQHFLHKIVNALHPLFSKDI
jgi:GAF domain-containing protein